jgi:hypothetical protein
MSVEKRPILKLRIETRPTTLKLSVLLLRAAKAYAANHDTTLQALVEEGLRDLLKRKEPRK